MTVDPQEFGELKSDVKNQKETHTNDMKRVTERFKEFVTLDKFSPVKLITFGLIITVCSWAAERFFTLLS